MSSYVTLNLYPLGQELTKLGTILWPENPYDPFCPHPPECWGAGMSG